MEFKINKTQPSKKPTPTPGLDALLSRSEKTEVFIPLLGDRLLSATGTWHAIPPTGMLPADMAFHHACAGEIHALYDKHGCNFLRVTHVGVFQFFNYREHLLDQARTALGDHALRNLITLIEEDFITIID